jgi:hypothetical protein
MKTGQLVSIIILMALTASWNKWMEGDAQLVSKLLKIKP